jgi:hypothetical protein
MQSRMQRRTAFCLSLMTFGVVLSSCTPVLAQQPAGREPVEPQAPAAAIRVDDRDANETRDRFRELLRQYPPSLAEVLQLDPSLLTNQAYLAPYPTLAAFLAQHPQIAHNPAFFVGEVNRRRWDAPNPREDAIRMWEQMLGGMAFLIVFAVVTIVLTWLVRTLIDYRRWLRLSKIQTDVHGKLLDRFTANEDLLAYMQTPAGQKFLESAPIPLDLGPRSMGAPLGRILWSVQAGLVLALGGIGLQYVSKDVIEDAAQPMYAMGVLGLMFGVGFILSAVVAYFLSRRLGLLAAATPSVRTPEPGARGL